MTEQSSYGRTVFVYQVATSAGERSVVSLVAPELVFDSGLSAEAIIGTLDPANNGAITPEGFHHNPAFVEYLSLLIGRHIVDVEDIRREAQRQIDGHIYLIDGRTPTPNGAVPPVDIIGAVTVTGGELVTGTYQHNPNHQLLTADGFFVLPPELETELHNAIRQTRSA